MRQFFRAPKTVTAKILFQHLDNGDKIFLIRNKKIESGNHMKKITSALLAVIFLFTVSACSSKTENSTPPSVKPQMDDDLQIEEGGTAGMTLFKCDNTLSACTDIGEKFWDDVIIGFKGFDELKDGAFIHVDAKYKLYSGGYAGYIDDMYIYEISNEKMLSPNEVISQGLIPPYDSSEEYVRGPHLIVKKGKNYIICPDLPNYRLYNDKEEFLWESDNYRACANYIEDDSERPVLYTDSIHNSYWVVRIGDIYYAHCANNGLHKGWKVLLNRQFENKPIGFDLEDGQVMKVGSTLGSIINGGEKNYVNVPMFEYMDQYNRERYAALNYDCSKDHWDNVSSYEDGCSYQYYTNADSTEYVIFCLEGRFHVYCANSSEIKNERLLGVFNTSEEVDKALGRNSVS